jgi:hypothetical protein
MCSLLFCQAVLPGVWKLHLGMVVQSLVFPTWLRVLATININGAAWIKKVLQMTRQPDESSNSCKLCHQTFASKASQPSGSQPRTQPLRLPM